MSETESQRTRRRWITGVTTEGSFEILDLLAELLDRELQGEADAGQFDIGGF